MLETTETKTLFNSQKCSRINPLKSEFNNCSTSIVLHVTTKYIYIYLNLSGLTIVELASFKRHI